MHSYFTDLITVSRLCQPPSSYGGHYQKTLTQWLKKAIVDNIEREQKNKWPTWIILLT